jgi:hypothetical protein
MTFEEPMVSARRCVFKVKGEKESRPSQQNRALHRYGGRAVQTPRGYIPSLANCASCEMFVASSRPEERKGFGIRCSAGPGHNKH